METRPEDNTIRILIADDHLIVRAGLTTLLGKEPGFVVSGGVQSGSEALAFLEQQSVDVVLLDLRMPNKGGLDVLPDIVSRQDPPWVLVLSSFEYEEEIYRAAKAGARGYVTKDVSRAEIVEAIRKVAAGQLHFPHTIAARLAERESRTGLSPREHDILRMISKGLTNKEIGRALQISQFTVRNHVIHILEKLHASDRTEAVSIALQQGIIGATV
jgi:DNA-binding NarL/FixJ family response regulator